MFPLRDNNMSIEHLFLERPLKKPNVRRALFGTPSPEKQNQDFVRQENRLREENDRERFIKLYGFDVKTGTPVVDTTYPVPSSSIPGFYTKGYPTKLSKDVFRPVCFPRRERTSRPLRFIPYHIPPRSSSPELLLDLDLDLPSETIDGLEIHVVSNSLPSQEQHSVTNSNCVRSHSAASTSRSSRGVNHSTSRRSDGSLRQPSITEHFPVKRNHHFTKSLPRP